MAFFKGSATYYVEAANTNRVAYFTVTAAGGVTNVFSLIKGNNAFHPWVNQVAAPTTNQKIANHRVSYIVRYLSIYAVPIFVSVASSNLGGGETNNQVVIGYETYVSNVYPDHTDITDAKGKADRSAKTKSGLQTLADNCVANASLDGGSTSLFAVNPALADGTVSTAAVIGITAGSLTVARHALTPNMSGY